PIRGCGLLLVLDDTFIKMVDEIRTEPFPKMRHRRSIKWCFFLQGMQTDEVLQVGIFGNGKHGFFITNTEFFFDDERTKCKADRISSASLNGISQALDIVRFNLAPRDKRSHDNPAIVRVQLSSKGKKKFIWHD